MPDIRDEFLQQGVSPPPSYGGEMNQTMLLDCGHEIQAGERWVSLAGSTRCYDCQTAEDKKYLRLPKVREFTARVAGDGGTIENGIGGTLGQIEWYEERKRAEVRTPDGRRWVSTNPIRNFFTRFELLPEAGP